MTWRNIHDEELVVALGTMLGKRGGQFLGELLPDLRQSQTLLFQLPDAIATLYHVSVIKLIAKFCFFGDLQQSFFGPVANGSYTHIRSFRKFSNLENSIRVQITDCGLNCTAFR